MILFELFFILELNFKSADLNVSVSIQKAEIGYLGLQVSDHFVIVSDFVNGNIS